MGVQSVADAGFYSLVHEVLEAEKQQPSGDIRGDVRRSFQCVQLIAPYTEERLPQPSEFRHVNSQDLSPSGMSYIDDKPPNHSRLLVLLGPAPFIFLTAEVAHYAPVINGGRTEYLIGCRFTGRLQR